jgi:hypothetical protein
VGDNRPLHTLKQLWIGQNPFRTAPRYIPLTLSTLYFRVDSISPPQHSKVERTIQIVKITNYVLKNQLRETIFKKHTNYTCPIFSYLLKFEKSYSHFF